MRKQVLMKKSGTQPKADDNTIVAGPVEPDKGVPATLPPDRPLATPAHYVPVRNETLEKRLSRRLDLMDNAMTDAEFEARLERATLKDMAVVEGIYIDKLRDLRGTPNRVVGSDTRAKLGEFMEAAVHELQRRGLSVKLTERTAEVTSGPQGPEPAKVIDAQ